MNVENNGYKPLEKRNTRVALAWIINILRELQIPFQIAGGLAAQAYGATRELWDIDIDIPENKFEILKESVRDFIIFGPTHIQEKPWDLKLMTLNYHGQHIDLSGAYRVKIFNQTTGHWHKIPVDFSKSITMKILGLNIPVISREELLAYKKILARAVDLSDVEEIEMSFQK